MPSRTETAPAAHRTALRSTPKTRICSYCSGARTCQKSSRPGWRRCRLCALTVTSRVIAAHSAVASLSVSVACHVPAAGSATSANHEYGGPPCRSGDLAATRPSGATSDSTPSIGFSVTSMTRSGAPFHGANGEGRTVSAAASPQASDAATAGEATVEKRNKAVAAAANRLAKGIFGTFWMGREPSLDPPPAAGLQVSRIDGDPSANLKAILRPPGRPRRRRRNSAASRLTGTDRFSRTPSRPCLLRLVDVPEDRGGRTVEHAGE